MTKSELVDISVQILRETEKAILVTEGLKKDGKRIDHWLPKSAVEGDLSRLYPEVVELTIPRWLYEEKGLT